MGGPWIMLHPMRRYASFLAIAVVVFTGAIVDLDLGLWRKTDRVIEWDVHGYYGYLPALFIHDDIKLEKSTYQVGPDHYLFWPEHTPDGKKLFKYPVGTAILYAPFFFVTRALVGEDDVLPGFSPPYRIALLAAGLCSLLLGLLALRQVLQRAQVRESTSAITLLTVGLGTNLFCYATQSGSMPHVHGFFLVALFLLATLRWYERPSGWRSIQVGAVFGLLTLVRPTNGVVGLFFLLQGIATLSDVRSRADLFRTRWTELAMMAVTAFVVWIPQFLYWYTVTGSPVFYSYQNEGFFFGHPHLLEGLFGFRKGWFIYTPVMFFAAIGILLMARERWRAYRIAVAGIFAVHVYITLSWWCWWYGGTFGQRAMVEIYPVMALPLCVLIDRISRARLLWRVPAGVLAVLFIALNIFQTYQFEAGAIHYDAMTWEVYRDRFGSMERLDGEHPDLDHPDYGKARSSGR